MDTVKVNNKGESKAVLVCLVVVKVIMKCARGLAWSHASAAS